LDYIPRILSVSPKKGDKDSFWEYKDRYHQEPLKRQCKTVEGDKTYNEKPGNIQLCRNPGQMGFNEGFSRAEDKAD